MISAFIITLAACAVPAQPVTIRVATFNIEDVRTEDLKDANQPRLKRIAQVIGSLRPNIILLNELAYDMPGSPGFKEGDAPGQNAQRFVDLYLGQAAPPAPAEHPKRDSPLPVVPPTNTDASFPTTLALPTIRYRVYMPPTNTGIPSGFDLDNDGAVTNEFPSPAPSQADGAPGAQSAAGRAYGGDCWGFGTFPGQYGFALLVDDRLTIDTDHIRTFQRLPWNYIQGAFLPSKPDAAKPPTSAGPPTPTPPVPSSPLTPWFTDEELKYVRICSKNFADIPVKLPNNTVIHILASHPTPPAFDGPEGRNKRRNHDEIRLIGDYIDSTPYLVDDKEEEGGLGRFDSFIILGDLNADPKKGDSFKDPVTRHLLTNRRINATFTPTADIALPGLDPTDTAMFKLRVDYVLPSSDITILRGGVYRTPPKGSTQFPSDHFPVYLDVTVPKGGTE